MQYQYSLPIKLLLLVFLATSGCAPLRTEFYRNETKHLYTTGCDSYKQGDYQQAQESFLKIVKLDPDYGPAYAALGNIAMIEENYNEAFQYYTQAVSFDPELEKELQPLLISANSHKIRQPLIASGVELSRVYDLVMKGKIQELGLLLQGDIPLELLAKDYMSLTPGKISELQQKVLEYAPTLQATVNVHLLFGYLLFYGELDDRVTSTFLEEYLGVADTSAKQQIYVLLGRLHERQGKLNRAVDDFLAAVDAGTPIEQVAHYLARIYKVDIETIVPTPQQKSLGDVEKSEEMVEPKIISRTTILSSSKQHPESKQEETLGRGEDFRDYSLMKRPFSLNKIDQQILFP